MKILASDFDGTLCPKGAPLPEENLEAVKAWRAAGNKFGIATGRGLSLILKSIKMHNVPFDFLVCTNGGVTFDENLNVLTKHCLERNQIEALVSNEDLRKSYYIIFFTERESLIYLPEGDSEDCRKKLAYIGLSMKDFKMVSSLDEAQDVIQISLMYPTDEETEDTKNALIREFKDEFQIVNNACFLDITVAHTNKGEGINDLAEAAGWGKDGIITVGDDNNDLPMLTRFEGYTVSTASDAIKEQVIKAYDSVADLIYDKLK